MRYAVIAYEKDVPAILKLFETGKLDSVLVLDKAALHFIEQCDAVVFAFSEACTYSTQYQELLLTALIRSADSRRYLLRLDDIAIPMGVEALGMVPAGPPEIAACLGKRLK